jgi:hypothetical protein
MSTWDGEAMRAWIAGVVREVGSRRPGTPGEAQAAERVAEAFRACCDEVRIEPVASRHGSFFGLARLTAAGYAAAFLLTFRWPGAALSLVLLLGAAFLVTGRGRFVLDPLFARTRTQNVIGTLRPRSAPRRLLLVSGHHDSPILMPLWRRKRAIPLLYRGSLAGFFAQGLFALSTLAGAPAAVRVPLGGLALAGLVATLVFVRGVLGWRRPCSGANDNLSSLAVVAALGRQLAEQRPQHVEVRLVSFGCEEEGRFGSRDFAARYAPELAGAVLLNMETVGAGELAIIRREWQGMRRYAAGGVDLLASAARRAGLEIPVVDLAFGATDALSFAEEGLAAATLFGRDASGLFALWHVEEDRPENLDPACLERALAVCRAAVAELDADAGL